MRARLGIGPMSSETIEAVFRYSEDNNKEIMLIASKNQIDYSGGYVNNWTTKEYSGFIKKLKLKYPHSNIRLCRDHCGPGFNGNYNLEDTYNTLKNDIEEGFDLIHIDFCKLQGSKEEILNESKKAIEYCLKLNPSIKLEIGTDENLGDIYSEEDLGKIEKDILFFKEFCNPEFYVIQTGSLVREINQIGHFNKDFVRKISKVLKRNGLKLKEHNADYLLKEEINMRNGLVDAMNIAPQFGTVQTSFVLTKCLQYGINYDNFLEEVYQGKKWEKWLEKNTIENKHLCFLIAGHYHFSSDAYKKIITQLNQYEDINESIIKCLMEVLAHYESN